MHLEKEFEAYQNKLGDSEWVDQNQGKYVLIKNDTVIQTFDSYSDALYEGYRQFGLSTFFVKQVRDTDHAHATSRMLVPCPTSH